MAADWTYSAIYPHTETIEAPPTLITRYDDGSETRRQKSSVFTRRFSEVYEVDDTDKEAMIAFYEARGLLTSFVKTRYSGDSGVSTEFTVRFDGPLVFERVSAGVYRATIAFVQLA